MASTPKTQPSRHTIDRHLNAVYAPIAMLAGMELDAFTPLRDGPMSAETLAEAIGVRVDKLGPLLYALVMAELLTVTDGQFANTPEADHYLVRGRPSYIGGAHAYYAERWRADLKTAATIRTGVPQAKIDFGNMSHADRLAFFRHEHAGAMAAGRELAVAQDFSRFHHLLDVAGGSGGLAIAVCRSRSNLHATVVDLPAVTPITERFIAEAGMSDRVGVMAADVVAAPLGGSFDLAILRNVIQVLSRDQARRTLRHVGEVLEPNGAICILGWVLDDSRLAPPEIAASNFAFLNIYDEGRAYTESEHRDWLTEAGFVDVARTIDSGGGSLVTARKS